MLIVLVISVFVLPRVLSGNGRTIEELFKMNLTDTIEYHGYNWTAHKVVTEDGYILQLFRLHSNKTPRPSGKQRPVLLMHGLLSSAADYIILGPESSLGYVLTDAGFDVWLGNARGNQYSRAHQTMNPDNNLNFWNFSWHEIGIYDLTAMIDYILNVAANSKLFYVGHSQGTTTYYVMLSEKPAYNDKIIAQYSMAPVAFMNHMEGAAKRLALSHYPTLEATAKRLGINEIGRNMRLIRIMVSSCQNSQTFKDFCVGELFSVCGYDYEQLNRTTLSVWLSFSPSTASLNQAKHYAQNIISGDFRKFDHGDDNMKYYGQNTPPKYVLGNIRAPIYLIYSDNDYLSSPIDVNRLYSALPDGNKYLWKIGFSKWNHLDYILANDINQYVNQRVLKSMREHVREI